MYDQVADLPLTVTGIDVTQQARETTSGFERVTTTVALRGAGATGKGEDVTYDTPDHDHYDALDLSLAGEYTLDSFSALLDDVDLWPEPPSRPASRHYRRWAFESAALDLALRQADTDLGSVLDLTPEPTRFVVSTRLPEADGTVTSTEPIDRLLRRTPEQAFKLDPTPAWDEPLIADLAERAPVPVVDLKALYESPIVETPAEPAFYRRVIEGFPDAIIEDPGLTDATRPLFDGHEHRLSWDYPITGVDAVRDLPLEPDWLNCKPSRFGTVESLLDFLDYCAANDISLYGGGQFELDVGRGQIQLLAALCYPDAPNDVAPGGYNDPDLADGLPSSPLDPPSAVAGFRWE
jgi:hypothetical protein